mmetsp:Transcript_8411/g.30774  ORF Transcript_8411/g.30774 Transcript_8411/m.30774 type:complete len:688 (+) Transcript_8411:414-2477(+)
MPARRRRGRRLDRARERAVAHVVAVHRERIIPFAAVAVDAVVAVAAREHGTRHAVRRQPARAAVARVVRVALAHGALDEDAAGGRITVVPEKVRVRRGEVDDHRIDDGRDEHGGASGEEVALEIVSQRSALHAVRVRERLVRHRRLARVHAQDVGGGGRAARRRRRSRGARRRRRRRRSRRARANGTRGDRGRRPGGRYPQRQDVRVALALEAHDGGHRDDGVRDDDRSPSADDPAFTRGEGRPGRRANGLGEDARIPRPERRAAVPREIHAAKRRRGDDPHADARARAADLQRHAAAHDETLADARADHRRREPPRGGGEARQGRQLARRDARAASRSHAKHEGVHVFVAEDLLHGRGGSDARHRVRGRDADDREDDPEGPTDDALLRDADDQGGGPGASVVEVPHVHRRRRRARGVHGDGRRAGLLRRPEREAVSSSVYVPEEEPEEEGDGVLLVVQQREVPRGAFELHRHPGERHSREAEAATADDDVFRVLQSRARRAPVHGRRRERAGHPGRGLDHPVRPPGRPEGIHSQGGANRARDGRPRARVVVSHTGGARVSQVPQSRESPAQRVRVPEQKNRQRAVAAREARGEELLPAPERARRVQGVHTRVQLAHAEGRLQRPRAQLGAGGDVVRVPPPAQGAAQLGQQGGEREEADRRRRREPRARDGRRRERLPAPKGHRARV